MLGLIKNWVTSGNWRANDDGFREVDEDNSKAYTGSSAWTDYEINTKIKIKEFSGFLERGILFRVNNESTGFRQQEKNDLMGYYAGVDNKRVFLRKLNYGSKPILEYEDNDAFTHGSVGLYSGNPDMYFKDITISNN